MATDDGAATTHELATTQKRGNGGAKRGLVGASSLRRALSSGGRQSGFPNQRELSVRTWLIENATGSVQKALP
jgi:hypothetical protein